MTSFYFGQNTTFVVIAAGLLLGYFLWLCWITFSSSNTKNFYKDLDFPLYMTAIELVGRISKRLRLAVAVKQYDGLESASYDSLDSVLMLPRSRTYTYDYYSLATAAAVLVSYKQKKVVLIRHLRRILTLSGIVIPVTMLILYTQSQQIQAGTIGVVGFGILIILSISILAFSKSSNSEVIDLLKAEFELMPEEERDFVRLYNSLAWGNLSAGLGFYSWLLHFLNPFPSKK